MTEREALKLAMEALEDRTSLMKWQMARDAVKEALMSQSDGAQPAVTESHKQEPVAFEKTVCPFCTSEWVTAEQHDRNVDRVERKPQRKPLTDEQIGSCIDEVNLTSQYGQHHFGWHKQFARAIEAAHQIKGEA